MPLHSAIFLARALRESKEELTKGVYIRFGTNRNVFIKKLILELLFGDDCALLAHTEDALQTVVNHFGKAALSFGQFISLKRIEVPHQSSPLTVYYPPWITINAHPLNSVEYHFQ